MNHFTKLTILVFILVTFNVKGYSQHINGKRSYEIGLNTFQFSDFTKFSVYEKPFSGILMPLIGVQLKIKKNMTVSHRFSMNYFQTEVHKLEQGYTFGSNLNAYNKGLDIKIGYEWLISKGRTSTYMVLDMIQVVGKRQRDGYYYGCFDAGSYDDEHTYYQVGFAPGVGIDIPLGSKFSLNLESNVVAQREFRREAYSDYWNPKHRLMINPLSRFSLNYRFTQKKSQP